MSSRPVLAVAQCGAPAVERIAGNYAGLCETFSSAAGEHQAGCPVPRPRQ